MIIFLREENLFSRDFNSHISPGDHDSVGRGDDLVNFAHTFVIFDFGNNFDPDAVFAKRVAHGHDVGSFSDERGENHVDTHFDAEEQIALVLFGNGGKVNLYPGQVDSLLRAQFAAVLISQMTRSAWTSVTLSEINPSSMKMRSSF